MELTNKERDRAKFPGVRICPHLALVVVAGLATGCRPEPARVVSVEWLEKGDEGHSFGFDDPVLLVTLDRPLPEGLAADRIVCRTAPRFQWASEIVEASSDGERNAVVIRILSGSESFRTAGIFRGGAGASDGPTGLGVDLGGGFQWVDVQPRKSHPVLRKVIWNDTGGDAVVNQGDTLRLIFNRAVLLGDSARESGVVQVPGDILLSNPEDRLDDGNVLAEFLESSRPKEILIRLGSDPLLTPLRESDSGALETPRSGSWSPSGLTINGTRVQPMEKIIDQRSRLGAVSNQERPIELPRGHPFFLALAESFPDDPPGHRTFLTASAAFGRGVVIAGGLREGSREPLRKIFLFQPDAAAGERLTPIGVLSEGRFLHTASVLPGNDGIAGTADDLGVVVAGGSNGERSLASLECIRLDFKTHEFHVEPIAQKLRFPRSHHSATVVPPNRIVFIGGLDQELGEITGVAEILTFTTDGEGRLRVKESPERRLEFRTLARKRHSATGLGPVPGAPSRWSILVYGGLGWDPKLGMKPGWDERFPDADAVILASPEWIQLDLEKLESGDPQPARVVPIPIPFDYAHVRYDHRAALVTASGPGDPGNPMAVQVFVCGGSLSPPNRDLARALKRHWEMPSPEDLKPEFINWPTGKESSSSLLFTLSFRDPRGSEVRIIPSPTGELRVHNELVSIPGLGLLSLGGEDPGRPWATLSRGEVYLDREQAVASFSVPLTSGRSRFAAAYLPGPDGGTVYLFGGAPGPEDAAPLAPVEAIHLR